MIFKRYIKGFSVLARSLALLFRKPRLFLYMIIPSLISIISLSLLIMFAFNYLSDAFREFLPQMDAADWAASILNVLWIITITVILFFTAGYAFLSVTKIFAAPFNDLLSEKMEIAYNETYQEPKNAFSHFLKTIVPTVIEEIKKVSLIVTGFILIYLLSFVAAPVSPILFVFYSISVVAIDFIDYPLARRQKRISEKIRFFRQNLAEMLGFGTAAFLLLMIPFLGLVVIQLAVIAGTLLFIDLDKN